MNIGLITLHSFYNYGSMLQAYALQHYLDTFRNDISCELIDYVPLRQDNNRSYRLWQDNPAYDDLREQYKEDLELRERKFSSFMDLYRMGKHYGSDEEIEAAPPMYDAYVSGSDQIWNVNFRIASRAYFLAFAKSKRKYAFATSVGRCTAEKLQDYAPYIQEYEKIYIREESGAERIRTLTGREDVSCMIDPTWLFDASAWGKVAAPGRIAEEPYIACYATLDDQLQDMMPILEAMHERLSLPVVLFGMVLPQEKPWIKNVVAAGPKEFLQILRGARLVFTMSFHGTIFSMNFGVPFLTYNDASENFRKTGVLKQFGLEGRIVHTAMDVGSALAVPIDFPKVQKRIAWKRAEAQRIISICLGGKP